MVRSDLIQPWHSGVALLAKGMAVKGILRLPVGNTSRSKHHPFGMVFVCLSAAFFKHVHVSLLSQGPERFPSPGQGHRKRGGRAGGGRGLEESMGASMGHGRRVLVWWKEMHRRSVAVVFLLPLLSACAMWQPPPTLEEMK